MEKIEEIALDIKTVYTPSEIKKYIVPVVKNIIKKYTESKTVVIGIQGGQGTGKTTLSNLLKEILRKWGYKVQAFSIDDFYETYENRKKLRKRYPDNPFYQISRGLPGTHRVRFLLQTLQKIKSGKPFEIPVFDKSLKNAQGDLAGTMKIKEKQEFILFEGWCVGIPVVSLSELVMICQKNKIKVQKIDPQGKYSQTVLNFTKKYQPLWSYLDYFIMFKPTSSEIHKQWRLRQEQELKEKTGKGMDKSEVEHFVDVFLPFTYVCYEKIKPDITLFLNEKHRIYRVK